MKWKTLQHNGILFPPPFETRGIKLKIKGEKVPLDLNQEEMIYQWAKKKDTPYALDKVFQKNFTEDFVKTLPSKFKKIAYEDLDFSDAYRIVDKEKDLKEMMTKEEKKAIEFKTGFRVVSVPTQLIKNHQWADIRHLFRAHLDSSPQLSNTGSPNQWAKGSD